MQTISQLIKAVDPVGYSASLGGRAFLVQSCDAGNTLTVTLRDARGKQYKASGVGPGFKAVPQGGFSHIDITTSADANVAFIVSDGDVDLQNSQVNVVVSNTSPIPVSISGGTVNVTASNVGISNTNANPVPVIDAYAAPVSVVWNSATAVNTAETLNTQGFDTVIFTIAPTGTMTAGAIAFEVYDGTNWIPVKAPRTDSYQTDSSFSLAGSSLHSWQLPIAGYPQVRARLSNAIVGSGTASVVAIVSSAPDVSLVTVGMDPSQPLPAGTNVIGHVNVDSLPALPAGTNAIGTVGVTALPALPAGANNIGTVGLAAGANNIGTVGLAAGNNTIGNVNVVDTLQARVLAGKACCGFVQSPAVASQYSRIQLWNPVGSGVNLYVVQITNINSTSTESDLKMYMNQVELTYAQLNGLNKLAGGGTPKGLLCYDSTASAIPANMPIAAISSVANVQQSYPMAEPFVVPPGWGLLMWTDAVNDWASVNIEWYEQ